MTKQNFDADSESTACVDWEVAGTLTGGDEELLNELIEMFPEEASKHLAAAGLAIEAGDGASLTRAAHTLKSSAKLFGATSLAARAQVMESLGRSLNFEDARTALPVLRVELDQVMRALRQGRPDR